MPYLINVVYLALAVVVSPWLLYQALAKRKYREGWAAKLFGLVPIRHGDEPCIWLHAVSVGEVNLLQPLIARLEQQHPQWQCVISTTTRSGLEVARRKYAPRPVFYCPLDFSWAVRTALRRLRPDLLVLAELELWPNLIRLARRRGVRVALVNGRMSERSYAGYRRAAWLVRRLLRSVDLVAVQDDDYAARFLELGARPETVRVTGSLKFDGAQTQRHNPRTRQLAGLLQLNAADVVLLAGSTQRGEEEMALAAFRRLADRYPQLKLLICPRHPERFDEVARLLDRSDCAWARRSLLPQDNGAAQRRPAEPTGHGAGHGAGRSQPRVLLIDAVGELPAWWGVARIAYVGGSMGIRGGQNMIEPAAYGAAVCFGPQTQNFRDVVRLMTAAKAAVVVHHAEELVAFVRRCLEQSAYASELGRRAQQLVFEQQGAAERTAEGIAELLRRAEPAPAAAARQPPASRRAGSRESAHASRSLLPRALRRRRP